MEAIEKGGEEGMEGRREAVKANILAENKVHNWKVHVCPLLNRSFPLANALTPLVLTPW